MIVRLAYMGYYKGFSCEMHHGIAELVPIFWMSMWSIEALLRAGSADGSDAWDGWRWPTPPTACAAVSHALKDHYAALDNPMSVATHLTVRPSPARC